MRTKSRKPKRFPFEFVSGIVVRLFESKSKNWYRKDNVDAKILGKFGYHWIIDGYFIVFHFDSGFPVLAYEKESQAKRLVKKLYLDKGIEITKITNKYNIEEDVPF